MGWGMDKGWEAGLEVAFGKGKARGVSRGWTSWAPPVEGAGVFPLQ